LREHDVIYKPFFTGEAYHNGVDRLEETWQTEMGDFVVQAAANVWGTVLVVHQPKTEPIIVLPDAAQNNEVLHLHFEHAHYDAITGTHHANSTGGVPDVPNGTNNVGAIPNVVDPPSVVVPNGTNGVGAIPNVVDPPLVVVPNGTNGVGAIPNVVDPPLVLVPNGTNGV
jgi:hypothetical protein